MYIIYVYYLHLTLATRSVGLELPP